MQYDISVGMTWALYWWNSLYDNCDGPDVLIERALQISQAYFNGFFPDADPSNYMSYYKRATVFMALSRSRPALTDLDKVIQLKPDFVQARVKRGVILTKMGRLDEAHIELERVLARDPGNDEANKLYVQLEPLQVSIREIRDFIASKNFQPALDRLSEVIEVKNWRGYAI